MSSRARPADSHRGWAFNNCSSRAGTVLITAVGAWLGGSLLETWADLCHSLLPRRDSQPNRGSASSESGSSADWGAPRPCHGGKPFHIHGFSAPFGPYRCTAQPHLEYSSPRGN